MTVTLDFIARAPWVTYGGASQGLATCNRCAGTIEPPALAGNFDAFVAYLNGMAAVHAACPDPNPPAEPEPAPAGELAAYLAASITGEEPVRQVDEPAADPLPEVTSATRVQSGAVFVVCRFHGTGAAVVRGSRAHCRAADCEESAEVPARGDANQRKRR